MRHPFTLMYAIVLALILCGGVAEASAASRSNYPTYSQGPRRGYDWRYYGYPRPGCTFAIQGYQRRWPSQLWPPSMRCFPYPN
jgi:hypothetical protein